MLVTGHGAVLGTHTLLAGKTFAAQARDENWSHEEYLAAVLQRQVAARESAGTITRIRIAHFPQVKTLEEFNLDHLPRLRRDLLALWVPRTLSRHATCTYSCRRPPSRSRRSGWMVAPGGGGVWPPRG